MKLTHWLDSISRRTATKRARRRSVASASSQLESLESRTLLSATPTLVKDIDPTGSGLAGSPQFLEFNGELYFTADDGVHGKELWKTDGTAGGTVMVADINPLGDSHPSRLTVANGKLYFRANDGVHGFELWTSNGTAAGTFMLANIEPDVPGNSFDSSSFPIGDGANAVTVLDGQVFFTAKFGVFGRQLFTTDGTVFGTNGVGSATLLPQGSLNNEAPRDFTKVGDTLFFSASDDDGRELWKTDGTAAGTMMVTDINPGSSRSIGGSFTNVDGTLFFAADDGVHGMEVWKSDGTAAGTVLVKDVVPGSSGSNPGRTASANGTFFFSSSVGFQSSLWSSNGTAAGTVQLIEGLTTARTELNGALIFLNRADAEHGPELWRSDGTPAGTYLIRDINPGSGDANPSGALVVDNRLYFAADDGVHGGRQLWSTDGVSTVRLTGGVPGFTGDTFLAHANGAIYFDFDDGVNGNELHKLDIADLFLDVDIDIDPNTVNTASNGMLTVNLHGSDSVDVSLVDVATLDFAGAFASQWAYEDVNNDGYEDLVLHYRVEDTTLGGLYAQLLADDLDADGVLDSSSQEAAVSLSGHMDDQLITGSDTVNLSLRGKALRELLDELHELGLV